MFIPERPMARSSAARLAILLNIPPTEARGHLARMLGFASWQALAEAMDRGPASPCDGDLAPGYRNLRRDVLQTRLADLVGVAAGEALFVQINPFRSRGNPAVQRSLALPAATGLVQSVGSPKDEVLEAARHRPVKQDLLERTTSRPSAYFELLSRFGWDLIEDSFQAHHVMGRPSFSTRDELFGEVPVFLFPSVVVPGGQQGPLLRAFQNTLTQQAGSKPALMLLSLPCWKKCTFVGETGPLEDYLTVFGQIYLQGKFYWLMLNDAVCSVSDHLSIGIDTSGSLEGSSLPVALADRHRSYAMAAFAALLDPASPEAALERNVTLILEHGWRVSVALRG